MQMTWSALKNIADSANAKADGALALATAIKECGMKGMIYAPGTTGVDATGCVAVKTGTRNGTNISHSGAARTYTLAKPSGTDVQISCSASATTGSRGGQGARASAAVSARMQTTSGWTTLINDSDSCHAYGDSSGCSVSASGTYRFYEKNGQLYRYSSAVSGASGVIVMGESSLMPVARWTGRIELSSNNGSCSVVQGL